MNMQLSERSRVFLVNWLFTTLYGMKMTELLRLLGRHRFDVDTQYLPRAAFMVLGSTLTSAFAQYEDRVYGPQVRDVAVKAPVFILGHWRSGTTLLHNLLSLDPQFAYASVWQALNPHTFLTTERFSKLVQLAAPKTRLLDNVGYRGESPLEDQLALNGTMISPFLRWVFPRNADYYDRYITFQGVPREEIEAWKAALLHFYKKITWRYNQPLLLKSPPHTGKIAVLLELFPDARFVHIHRHPFAVFQSSKRETDIVSRVTRLQQPIPRDMDEWIIQRYKTLYDAFFEQRELIPPGQFCELSYEDLAADMVGQVRRIYQDLSLPGFDTFLPTLQRYVDAQGGYRKNSYKQLPDDLRERIMQAWGRSFEAWGYAAE